LIIRLLPSVYHNAMLLPGAALSGLSVFFILSTLLVPINITTPTSIIISIIVYGLTKVVLKDETSKSQPEKTKLGQTCNISINQKSQVLLSSVDIIFVSIYVVLTIFQGVVSEPNKQLFEPWNQFSIIQIMLLAAAVPLCFFVPGYAIVNLIDNKRQELRPVLKLLLAYVLSMLITGLTGYISAYLELDVTITKLLFTAINIFIIVVFIAVKLKNRHSYLGSTNNAETWTQLINQYRVDILVFASLFVFIILSTYYLYNGTIIGDQWFHHGRSLLFMAGAFTSVSDTLYPFFFHSVLATYFSVSGVPSVNAYVFINFLNIMPVLAFYYFFKKWIPNRGWGGAALLACALFMLSSGFGWVNIVSLTAGANHPISQLSALEILYSGAYKTGDIQQPTTFIDTAQPEPTSPLLLLALPTGFILLALIKENLSGKFKYIAILTVISTLGVLSHDEFYLFILVGSILPLAFRLPHKNSVYASFLFALSVVILADNVFPIKYYTVRDMFGIPLAYLCLFFIAIIWVLYIGLVFRDTHLHSTLKKLTKKIFGPAIIRLTLGMGLIVVVSYFYVFTFIVWGEISQKELNANTSYVPWYLYPMKFGVTGMLGLAFVLSYFFKKYEKEVFIFGIIAAIAFLCGPYYDEHRFSKYIMVGMVGFASLLVYKIIFSMRRFAHKSLLSGLIMGAVVTSSSLSTLLFFGYTALALENPDFEGFHWELPRRIFPSAEEIRFLNYLHNDLIDLKTDNVTVPPDWYGLNSKLEGFVGTSLASLPKFLQSPNTLSSSSLEGFYSLLNYSTSRYIVLPKSGNLDLEIGRGTGTRFALENFQKMYEDANYVVMAVPSLAPPSSSNSAGVAMIYQPDGLLLSSIISGEKILSYNNEFIKGEKNPNYAKIGNKAENETINVTIYGDKKRTSFWSKPLQEKDSINYIESTFRIIAENKTSNDAGIMWDDENKEYTVSVRDNRLEVLVKSIDINNSQRSDDKKIIGAMDIKRENGIWYTLKIAIMNDLIKIYLNDLLAAEVPTFNNSDTNVITNNSSTDNTAISRVGVFSFNNVAEFKAVKTGQISDTGNKTYQKETYYHHYYPLSALALSNSGYETFVDGDFSSLSKKTAILTWDPMESSRDTYNKYLEFVKKGGTLVIINTDRNFSGLFSKLLSISAGNATRFDSILYSERGQQQILNVSGFVGNIASKSPDAKIKSFYVYDNRKVAPFAIEKNYGGLGGRIIIVNGVGYFDAIFRSPEHFFLTLANFPNLIDLTTSKYREAMPIADTAISGARFYGDLSLSGDSAINSSSLILPSGSSGFYPDEISVLNIQNGSGIVNLRSLQDYSRNLEITNLTLYGTYEGIIESAGELHLPSSPSYYDYVDIPIPAGSNMTLRLSNGATAEFNVRNDILNYTQHITIADAGEIKFNKIIPQNPFSKIETIPDATHVLMKSPNITVNGNISSSKFYNPNFPFSKERSQDAEKLVTRVDHVDNYRENNNNGSETKYITYLSSTQFEESTNADSQQQLKLKIPGNMDSSANETIKMLSSTASIVALVMIIFITTMFVWRFRPKIGMLEGP
jgi:hypothetical protein